MRGYLKQYWKKYVLMPGVKQRLREYKRKYMQEYRKRGYVQARQWETAEKLKAIFYADLKELMMKKMWPSPERKMLYDEMIKTIRQEIKKLVGNEQQAIKSVFFEGKQLEALSEFERMHFDSGLEMLRQSKALRSLME
ncbi:hypothetical protein HZB89_02410 [archaeon]|nr:hypothetical protein [archaeon]